MKITVSLSRLHKLCDRIKAMVRERNAEAKTLLSKSKTWHFSPTDDVQKRIRNSVEKGKAAFTEGVELARELAKVRAVISQHNEKRNISARMGLVAALQIQLDSLVDILESSAVYTNIEELPVGSVIPEGGVSTNVLTDADRVAIIAQRDELQREIYGLTDSNAEENSKTVEIDLPENLAKLVTA